MTEKDPNGVAASSPGAKLDAGKSPVRRGLLEYFPRACMAVADVSASGAGKYTWGGWQTVENGIDRYGDAEVRHICKAAIEGPVDKDFGLLHAAHEAWNALARLELLLREAEKTPLQVSDLASLGGGGGPITSGTLVAGSLSTGATQDVGAALLDSARVSAHILDAFKVAPKCAHSWQFEHSSGRIVTHEYCRICRARRPIAVAQGV